METEIKIRKGLDGPPNSCNLLKLTDGSGSTDGFCFLTNGLVKKDPGFLVPTLDED
jgi:hypothetical protein